MPNYYHSYFNNDNNHHQSDFRQRWNWFKKTFIRIFVLSKCKIVSVYLKPGYVCGKDYISLLQKKVDQIK